MAYKVKFKNPTKKDLKIRICDIDTGELFMDACFCYMMFATGWCEDVMHQKLNAFIDYLRFHPNAEFKISVYDPQDPETIEFPDVY